jgi:hypothetical protein
MKAYRRKRILWSGLVLAFILASLWLGKPPAARSKRVHVNKNLVEHVNP